MKHTIIIFLILTGYLSQGNCQFRPLKSFGNDTMAYMVKNYDGGALYRRGKTLGTVLTEADVSFRSYVIAENPKYPAIVFGLLFTATAEEVRRLYKSGKPVYGVFCDFTDNIYRYGEGEIKDLYNSLSALVPNQINDLDDGSVKVLKDIRINWAWFSDKKGWFPIYKIE